MIHMHPAFSRCLADLLIDRRDGHRHRVVAAFREKTAFDRRDAADRAAARDEALASLLDHARTSVPFYRDLLARHDRITPAKAFEVLSSLPVIGRADIQKNPDAFRAAGATEVFPDATGGSTGTPLKFWVDRATQRARESSLYWADSLAGWNYGERIAMLWGSDKDVASATRKLKVGLRWLIDNRRWFNAFNMGEERMAEFHRAISTFRPHLIVAYAGSMDVYARFLRDRGIRPDYPLRGIVCSAEVLTPQARRTIGDVFGRPVFDRYGNREFGAIASECSAHDGLHLNERDFVTEIDSRVPAQDAGSLIVTYLHNRAMPFIRYNTGDLARFHAETPCSCGRSTRRLAAVTGRMADTIRTKSGKLIHGEYFTHLMYRAGKVREFQFVQDTLERYRLLLVADERETDAVIDSIRRDILEEVGADCRVEIQYVDSIPVLSSGKRKFTLSMLKDA